MRYLLLKSVIPVFFSLLLSGCAESSAPAESENAHAANEKRQRDETNRPSLDAPPPPPPGITAYEVDEHGELVPLEYDQEEITQTYQKAIDGGWLANANSAMNSDAPAKYDDAEWHYGGEFPEDVPEENGYTHIGFYLSWAVQKGLLSEYIKNETADSVEKTLNRQRSPIHLLQIWDGKLVDDMLNDEGNEFTRNYYALGDGKYFTDLAKAYENDGFELYRVSPSWENYEKIEPVLNKRFEAWRSTKKENE